MTKKIIRNQSGYYITTSQMAGTSIFRTGRSKIQTCKIQHETHVPVKVKGH